MVQKFWRIRLGAAKEGYDRFEKVFDLCKNETTPCLAVGWGELDLSKEIEEIKKDWKKEYSESFGGIHAVQIKRWVEMKNGDNVIAMIRPGTICSVGKIIKERYYKKDNKFKIEIEGYEEGGDVWFFNRIDVKWIIKPDNYIKIKSLDLPKDLAAKLNIPMTIIKLESGDFKVLKDKIDLYKPEIKSSTPKYGRKYDVEGKSGR
ncbi:MAG: hypothetical protein SCH39_12660 [Methanosarcinales archaeon]|nr:hypothetical protein [Methanosarcinales archaeon]